MKTSALMASRVACRLLDVIHDERALWLVFEHLDLDMKQFMDTQPQFREEHGLIKVRQLVRCTSDCSTSMLGHDGIQLPLSAAN